MDTGRDTGAAQGFAEHMALTLAALGFPRMPARILMTVMTADEESLTSAELAARLDASAAAISGGVRYLIQIGILRRHPVPGGRRHAYSLPDDAWYTTMVSRDGVYRRLSGMAGEGLAAFEPGSPSAARVAEMRDFFLFLDGEMNALLDRWHAERRERP